MRRTIWQAVGPWLWLFGCGAAGVLIMLVVLNLTAVRSVDALPALPTREPTETDVPRPSRCRSRCRTVTAAMWS